MLSGYSFCEGRKGEIVVLEERMLTRTLDVTVFFIWLLTSKMGSLPLSIFEGKFQILGRLCFGFNSVNGGW